MKILKNIVFIMIVIASLATFFGFVSSRTAYLTIIDLNILDAIMLQKEGIDIDENIILVNIDDACLKEKNEAYGPNWRKYHRKILDQLKEAKVIAFDIHFKGKTEHDEALSESMKKAGNVVIVHEGADTSEAILLSSKAGYANYHKDIDCKVRRLALVKLEKGPRETIDGAQIRRHRYNPSFIFRIIQTYLGQYYEEKDNRIYGIQEEGDELIIGTLKIIRDNEGMMHVRNIKKGKEFREINYCNVLKEGFDRSKINKNTIIIIGTTIYPGDVLNTPGGEKRGILFNALALNTILKAAYIRHSYGLVFLTILFAASFVFGSTFTQSKKLSMLIVGIILVLSLVPTYLSYWIQTIPIIIALGITYLSIKVLEKYAPSLQLKPKKPFRLMKWFKAATVSYLFFFFIFLKLTGEPELLYSFLTSLAAAAFYDQVLSRKKPQEKTGNTGENNES